MKRNLFILAIAALTTSAFAQWSTPVQCPYDGKFYSLRQAADQWNDARSVANNSFYAGRRGHLAEITNTAVRDWVLANYYRLNPGYVLIGGRRGSSATGWIWDFSNTTMAVNSTYWAPGEPNNFQGRETVAALNFGSARFEDVSPNGTYYYLVQY